MPRLKKVMPVIRTVADIDSGLIAVAREYRAIAKVKKAECVRLNNLLVGMEAELEALEGKVALVDDLVARKDFNANV